VMGVDEFEFNPQWCVEHNCYKLGALHTLRERASKLSWGQPGRLMIKVAKPVAC
jgi:hypothetical protein